MQYDIEGSTDGITWFLFAKKNNLAAARAAASRNASSTPTTRQCESRRSPHEQFPNRSP